jgi:hypothetical protein
MLKNSTIKRRTSERIERERKNLAFKKKVLYIAGATNLSALRIGEVGERLKPAVC